MELISHYLQIIFFLGREFSYMKYPMPFRYILAREIIYLKVSILWIVFVISTFNIYNIEFLICYFSSLLMAVIHLLIFLLKFI